MNERRQINVNEAIERRRVSAATTATAAAVRRPTQGRNPEARWTARRQRSGEIAGLHIAGLDDDGPVSYTHLTLPTIYSV